MSNTSAPARTKQLSNAMPGPMESMQKMMPAFDNLTFWLAVNVVLFLYVGIFELAYGYGPGTFLSAGAIILAIIYLLLWMMSKGNRKMAQQWIMLISGLAVLGDLVVVAWVAHGSFSGTSALLDFAGIMLFRTTYKGMRSPS